MRRSLIIKHLVKAQLTGIYGSKVLSPRAHPEDKVVYIAINPMATGFLIL